MGNKQSKKEELGKDSNVPTRQGDPESLIEEMGEPIKREYLTVEVVCLHCGAHKMIRKSNYDAKMRWGRPNNFCNAKHAIQYANKQRGKGSGFNA